MKASNPFRHPATWLTVVFMASAALAWPLSPSLRLRLRGDAPAHLAAHAVNAHEYDDVWFDAARAGRIDILDALLDAGYPIDSTTRSGYTAVILTAYDGQPAALDHLIERGANACLGDRNGNTALMGSLYKGELVAARRLLRTPCAIDQTNNAGETPLAFAALFGRLGIINELVDRGADPRHRDTQGDTPVDVASRQGNQAAVEALQNAVGRTIRSSNSRRTP